MSSKTGLRNRHENIKASFPVWVTFREMPSYLRFAINPSGTATNTWSTGRGVNSMINSPSFRSHQTSSLDPRLNSMKGSCVITFDRASYVPTVGTVLTDKAKRNSSYVYLHVICLYVPILISTWLVF